MNPARLEELILQLHELPPRPAVTDRTKELFAGALAGLTDEQIETGFRLAAVQCEFVPAPATIRRLAGAPPIAAALTMADRADIAYREASSHRDKNGGSMVSVHFADGLTAATIRELGGWQEFDETKRADLPWEQKNFVRIYQQLATVGITPKQAEHLAGDAELENCRNGRATSQPPRVCATILPALSHVPCLPLPKQPPKRIPQSIPEARS